MTGVGILTVVMMRVIRASGVDIANIRVVVVRRWSKGRRRKPLMDDSSVVRLAHGSPLAVGMLVLLLVRMLLLVLLVMVRVVSRTLWAALAMTASLHMCNGIDLACDVLLRGVMHVCIIAVAIPTTVRTASATMSTHAR